MQLAMFVHAAATASYNTLINHMSELSGALCNVQAFLHALTMACFNKHFFLSS